MTTFKVAHLHEQGQDMIIVLVNQQPSEDVLGSLQVHANRAGMRGTVVPVWPRGSGSFGFIAPRPWHGFFSSLSWSLICRNVNRTLTCG